MGETKKKTELDNYDREQLKDLLAHPGWPKFELIQTRLLEAMELGTKLSSMQDPLGNKDNIAHAWAYYRMGLNVKEMVMQGVKREIAMLDNDKPKRTPDEERQRAATWFGTGQIGPMPDDFEAPKH